MHPNLKNQIHHSIVNIDSGAEYDTRWLTTHDLYVDVIIALRSYISVEIESTLSAIETNLLIKNK